MSAVLELCDRWDALSKGETETTRAVREAYAADVAAGVLTSWPACGQRSVLVSVANTAAAYSEPCALPKGHRGGHQDAEGFGWQESVR